MKFFKKIIILLAFLIFLWLLAEILLISAPPLLAFLRDPKILWGGQKDSYKIYCLGDSFTYGMGMKSEKAYPAILNQKLQEIYPDKKIEVYNLGRPSYGLSYVYYTIKEFHENRKDLNAVFLILGGWNVSDYDFSRFDKEQSSKIEDRLKLFLNKFRTFRFIKSYLLFKKLYYPYGQEDYVPPFWAKTNYNFIKYQKINLNYLEKIAKYAQQYKIKLVLLNYPQNLPPKNPYTDKEVNHFMFSKEVIKDEDYLIKDRDKNEIAINSIIRFIAKKYNFPLIDINKAFQESEKSSNGLFQEDYYHPTEEGQKIIAETVFRYLELNWP